MNGVFPLPSSFLPARCSDVLRSVAPWSEERRDLHKDQLDIIYREGWFRLFIPSLYGGTGMSLPEAVRLEEGISWADGSVGWTVTLCSGAGWFAGFLPPGLFSSLLSDPQLCLAGSGAATGEAVPIEGGYRVSGRWDYASGALHATGFTANCRIGDSSRIRPFLFKREEVQIDRTWDTIGLIATGSHAFEVKGLEVSADRCFEISPEKITIGEPLYRYAFGTLAEVTLAVNLSGMAVHFLDCCEDFFRDRMPAGSEGQGKMTGEMGLALPIGRSELNRLRQVFYQALDHSWKEVLHSREIPETHRGAMTRISYDLASGARKIVDRLYPYCGLGAARPGTEINRVWRDIHTASQHRLLAFRGEI